MLFLAAFVMLLLYPALHEVGHAAAALCFGAELKRIALFPVPCTTMVFFGASGTKLLVTAFCGSLFPLLLLALPDLGSFSLYDIKLTAALITAADSLTSLISVLCDSGCVGDAALVPVYYPELRFEVWVISGLILAAALLFCVLSRPLRRIEKYLLYGRSANVPTEAC